MRQTTGTVFGTRCRGTHRAAPKHSDARRRPDVRSGEVRLSDLVVFAWRLKTRRFHEEDGLETEGSFWVQSENNTFGQ